MAQVLALYWPRIDVQGPVTWSDKVVHVLLFLLPISGRREERSPEIPSASRDLQVVTTSMAVRAR